MAEAILEARGLSKSYKEVRAVDDVSLSLEEGQICGLLGPNGAGKTTTIRMMLGLVYPDAGSTSLLGERVTPGAPVLSRVGAMVEEAEFYPFLSGRRNLELHQRSAGAGDRADIERVLEMSALGAAADRRVKTYSHGMRQRLGLARALLGNPSVLILDEPTTGLDPAGIREVRDLLTRMANEGCAVLLSSHLLAEVELLCTHAVVMRSGHVIASGEIASLTGGDGALIEVDDPARGASVLRELGVEVVVRGDELHAGRSDGIAASDLVRALVENGIAVRRLQPRTRLEDTFFEITEAAE